MLRSFKHKGLKELFEKGYSKRVTQQLHARALRRLDALDQAELPQEMNIPGFDFHGLKGHKPKRYSVHVNGNFCITFSWDGKDAVDIDLEDYH